MEVVVTGGSMITINVVEVEVVLEDVLVVDVVGAEGAGYVNIFSM